MFLHVKISYLYSWNLYDQSLFMWNARAFPWSVPASNISKRLLARHAAVQACCMLFKRFLQSLAKCKLRGTRYSHVLSVQMVFTSRSAYSSWTILCVCMYKTIPTDFFSGARSVTHVRVGSSRLCTSLKVTPLHILEGHALAMHSTFGS